MTDKYTTSTMLEVLDKTQAKPNFLLDMFFRRQQNFDTAEIFFDEVQGHVRLAPFVMPHVAGQPMAKSGYATKTFTPAYVKPKCVIEPGKALVRHAGEPLGGNRTPQSRHAEAIAKALVDQREQIDKRLEWMAAEILQNGSVTIQGESYPTVTVDYGRAANLNVTLTGAACWDTATATPVDDLEEIALRASEAENGRAVTDFIFGVNAWKFARRDQQLTDLLNTNQAFMNQTPIDVGPLAEQNVQFLGVLNGRFRLWLYGCDYENDDGQNVRFLDPDCVIAASQGVEGVQAFGAILDCNFLRPARYWPKQWESQDPSVCYVMTQSAPLLIPRCPNASAKLRICDVPTTP